MTLPLRVTCFRRLTLFAILCWPLIAVCILKRVKVCSEQLRFAVAVTTVYYVVAMIVWVVVPASIVSVTLFLLRCGCIRLPRSERAARDGLVDELPKVPFDPAKFNDGPGNFPKLCPICFESFDSDRHITKAVCAAETPHIYHTSCLRGWLQLERTCPLCRGDIEASFSRIGTESV